MQNLRDRRKTGKVGNRTLPTYPELLSKVWVGKTLDVGCGSMPFKSIIPDYTGVDSFPVNDQVINMDAEALLYKDNHFDTVLCFAALDGMYDIEKAVSEMKRVASENVVFLTGVGIEPDEYHTFKIEEAWLDSKFPKVEYKEYFNRVMLVSYACTDYAL
jgi:SAM-dependent methyltransferase